MYYSTQEDAEFVRYWLETYKVQIFFWKVLMLLAIYPMSYIITAGNVSTNFQEVAGNYIITFCVWGLLNIFDVILDKIISKFNIKVRRVF